MKLRDKVVLLTGASEGIGAASARILRDRGAKLSLVARRREKLEAVGGSDAVVTAGDLCEPATRQRAVEATLERFGRIDVLINNAGVGMYAPGWRSEESEVRRLFELNFFAALSMIQLVVPAMRECGGGTIVNVSSIAGKIALPWFPIYSPSKFALCALTDSMRIELAPDRIHMMAVCPGYVQTRFQKNVLSGEVPPSVWRMRGFAITPEECARALVRGLERDARTVVTPWAGVLAIWASSLFPRISDYILARDYRDLDMK
jgi:short-subunit dehydrogenase